MRIKFLMPYLNDKPILFSTISPSEVVPIQQFILLLNVLHFHFNCSPLSSAHCTS